MQLQFAARLALAVQQMQSRRDKGLRLSQLEIQLSAIDEELRRAVVLQVDGSGIGVSHGVSQLMRVAVR